MTQEQRKEQAIKYMTTLDIYKPYIKGFKENDQVCFYEQFAGFWVDQEPEVYKKMKVRVICLLSRVFRNNHFCICVE